MLRSCLPRTERPAALAAVLLAASCLTPRPAAAQGTFPPDEEDPLAAEDRDPWREGEPPPGEPRLVYRRVDEVTGPLLTTGIVLLAVGYGTAMPVEAGGFSNYAWLSFVPVAGPWLRLGLRDDTRRPDLMPAYLTLNGLTQLAGAVCITVAIANPRTKLVRVARPTTLRIGLGSPGATGPGVWAAGEF